MPELRDASGRSLLPSRSGICLADPGVPSCPCPLSAPRAPQQLPESIKQIISSSFASFGFLSAALSTEPLLQHRACTNEYSVGGVYPSGAPGGCCSKRFLPREHPSGRSREFSL